MNRPARKVLVFGLDGADWRVLGPLVESGRVPTLARLVREGASGPLASTVHPHSATAWSSFLTGADPGRHGIFDFTRRRAGSYDIEVVSTVHRGGRAVWQVLSENGVKCGIVNVPMTHPPEKVLGYFVSGVFTAAPFANFTFPRPLIDEIRTALGGPYVVEASRPEFGGGDDAPDDDASLQAFAAELRDVEDQRAAASAHLIRAHRPSFAVHVDIAPDRAQHTFWRYHDASRPDFDASHPLREAINETYVTADRNLARLWEAMGEDTTVIVLSDHGGGPFHRVLLINQWLEAEGYLVVQRPKALSPRAVVRRTLRSAYQLAKRTLPGGVRKQLSGRFDAGRATSMRMLRPTMVDWTRTRAFSEGTFGNIVINVRGREAQGAVAPGANYDALREEIRGKLEKLVDPETGERAVEHVYLREELYHGPRVGEAPDIVAVLREGYRLVGDFALVHRGAGRAVPKGRVFAGGRGHRFKISGIHGPTGIFLAHGPGVAPGARIEGARIVDLAPTALALYGIATPAEMDGRVLLEVAGAAETSAGAAR